MNNLEDIVHKTRSNIAVMQAIKELELTTCSSQHVVICSRCATIHELKIINEKLNDEIKI